MPNGIIGYTFRGEWYSGANICTTGTGIALMTEWVWLTGLYLKWRGFYHFFMPVPELEMVLYWELPRN